jgi:hypothetical protein
MATTLIPSQSFFAQTENVKRELHRLPLLLRLVSVRPDESGCFDWRDFAKKGNPNKKELNRFA